MRDGPAGLNTNAMQVSGCKVIAQKLINAAPQGDKLVMTNMHDAYYPA